MDCQYIHRLIHDHNLLYYSRLDYGHEGKKIPTYNLAKKRLRSLGYPYIYWTGIILSFDIILWAFGYYDSYFIARETYKSIVLRGIGTLWFLPALFFGEIIWNWLSKRHWSVWLLVLIVIMIYEHEYNNFLLVAPHLYGIL